MEVMRQQDGESPLPYAIPLDAVAPTPPSLVVRVQMDQPISSNHSSPSFDSANFDRLRVTGQLARAIRDLTAATNPLVKLKTAGQVRALLAQLGEEAPDAGTPNVGEESDDPNSPNYRYRDTGYIADSRKERAASVIRVARENGTMLRASDVDWSAIEQNPRAAKDLITKSNLFGQVNWSALKEVGMDPAAGFLIDRIYASIASEPSRDDPQARKDYTIGIETIRGRMEKLTSVDEVIQVLKEIRDELGGVTLNEIETAEYSDLGVRLQQVWLRQKEIRQQTDALYGPAVQAQRDRYGVEAEIRKREGRGWKVDDALRASLAAAVAQHDREWAVWSDFLAAHRDESDSLQGEHRDIREAMNTIEKVAKTRNLLENQVTRSWLTFGERFMKLLNYRAYRGGSDAFAGHVTNARSGKIPAWDWAEKERTVMTRATKEEVAFQLKVADSYARRGGRDVTAASTQALKDQLGFREVQSGNWVLKDPNSAKFHVEQTAAAMADLSDLLGIPEQSLGLGGRLGMAFGARGSGGKNAARAHYEPVQRVINLTKMGGGGALGHEWFHAIDNILGELVNQKPGSKASFLTVSTDLIPDGPIKDAFNNLRVAMLTGDRRTAETIKITPKDVATAKYNIDREYTGSIATLIKQAGGAEKAVLAVDARFAGAKTISKVAKGWRKIAAAYYAPEGASEVIVNTGPMTSHFKAGAVDLDKGDSGKYWSQTEELSARAFQAFLEDKLAESDRRNDYLSVNANNAAYVDPFFGTEPKPFPEGDERVRINAAFESLFAALREAKVFEKAIENTALLDAIFGGEPLPENAAA